MATLRIKRSTGSTAPTTLANAELAYSEGAGILYIGVGTGGAGGSATTINAIGGTGAFVGIAGTQTITGAKTFSGTVALGSSATATTPATSDNSTTVATTAYVRAQAGVVAGVTSQTANTVWAAPNGSAGTPSFRALVAADVPALTAAKISDFDTQVRTSALNQLASATGNYSMGGNRITNLATPTADTDAATKAYVDASRAGLDVKLSVRVATTANITLSGTQTVDGVALVAGDRVLVKNQTTQSQNGIYAVAAGAWARTTDADSADEVHAGMFTFVTEGSTQADTGWVLTANDPIVLGTTVLTFAQFSGGGGLPATGANTIVTVGTLTSGALGTGFTAVAVAQGGTGLTTAINGLVKGNGTAYSVAVLDTDYLSPNSTIDGGTF
jgi:hypothetical protein